MEEDFFHSLIKKSPSSYDALLGRVEKYIYVEEAKRSRKSEGEFVVSPQQEKKVQ